MSRILLSAVALISIACAGPTLQQGPVASSSSITAAAAAPPTTLPNENGSTKFLVIGDTGTGGSSQYQVGQRIIEARQRFPFDFAIMLGDNLYGSEGPSAYVNKFEKPYKPLLDAGVKFYASLGNHDEPAQRFYKPFNMDGKRYYTFKKGDVEFFVLDSTYMTPDQLAWLKEALAKSNAKWKVAYFHHPIYSSGERHGSELDLQTLVEPLFVEHGVDVVFSGHEHFYERIKPQKGIVYITQGGGAKLRAGNIRRNSALTAKGFDTDNSFTLVEIVDDTMYFETISRRAQTVDSGRITRREVAATTTTAATQ